MTQAVDELVQRSGDLKGEMLEFSRRPRFDRAFRQAVRVRFGGPVVVGDEHEVTNFFDWFLQQYRMHDGRTMVDCFVDSRADLPAAERDFLLGWRDVREGIFEVVGRDGPVLVTDNLVDDLPYRIHANVGPHVFDQAPPGSFLVTRVVPVCDEWLLSGASRMFRAEDRQAVLTVAARVVAQHPELVYRNPHHLERGWQVQRAQHEAFVRHFGTDEVTVSASTVSDVMRGYLATLGGKGPSLPWGDHEWCDGGADTVGIIYDEVAGLNLYVDYALVQEAFADPDLLRNGRHKQTVKAYIADDSVNPVPLQRLAARYPDNAGRVIRSALGKPGLSWERDGERVLWPYKKAWYERPLLPTISIVSDRLAAYLRQEDLR